MSRGPNDIRDFDGSPGPAFAYLCPVMVLKTLRFFTIMLTAVALAAALAHLMERPGKMPTRRAST